MKHILILSNHHNYTYNFRKEIIQALLDKKYKVTVVQPYGEKVEKLKEMGCVTIDLPLDRRGLNPIKDIQLLFSYYKILKQERPDAVLSYTIKPNTYGGIACRLLKIPFYPNITGLGTAVENDGPLQTILVRLYRFAFKKAACIFFQNEENRQFFIDRKIAPGKHTVIPGSGINLQEFPLLDYPSDEQINFLFISRIMKEKGIDQYLEAAEYIKNKYPNTNFHILGFCEDEAYLLRLKELEQRGIVQYHGMQNNVQEFHKISHCTIHPTYYPEGMSNVLLESAASGRPIITTDRSGCREIVDHGVNGYRCNVRDSNNLIEKIEKFLSLTYEDKKEMGIKGRAKVASEFDRYIIVKSYTNEIQSQIN